MSIENQYIKRLIDVSLQEWAASSDRKTLMLRGARQVGKSSAVRQLGKQFKYFVEVNFDENEDVKALFEKSLSPQEICRQLSFLYDTPIIPGETLLFFDEIQSCIPAISKLRYFYEKYPELHLVTAGSLWEFALEEITSYGVGRVRHLFMYPFSFEEFLGAMGENMLVEAYRTASPSEPLFGPVHEKLLNRLRIFLITGGSIDVYPLYAISNLISRR
ncbi:MAG: AAA family ATPase [Rikenellaceae bacterium]